MIRPIKFKKKYYIEIEKKIKDFLILSIYKDIDKIISEKPIFNTNNDIIQALNSGTIQYVNGSFSGKFNAKISKSLIDIGATFDSRTKMYNLPLNKMPMDISQAIATTTTFYATQSTKLVDAINLIKADIGILNIVDDYTKTLSDLDSDIVKTLKKEIEIVPELTEQERANLAEGYNNNIKLFIKDFIEEETKELRELVEKNAFAGNRATNLQDIIKKRKDISFKKAKFLARQETALLVSKYKQQKYQSAGITKYRWSTSKDERVRQIHKDLNNTIHEFSNPPITDNKGNKNNPGEDFGCRCVAIPILGE